MNLKQLEVLLSVVETRSFSKAAEATFITQSTVSQHISSLEAEFGLKLLDRTGKAALPTEGGKILLEFARGIVSQAREIPLAMRRFKGLEDVSLRIGASNIPGNYMIPAVLPLFTARYPRVSLMVLQGDSHETLDHLKKGEIEIGIIGTLFEEKDVDFRPLGQDRISLVVRGDHRWSREKQISLKELLRERFVIREVGSGTEKTVQEALIKAGIQPGQIKVQASLGSNEAVKQAVAQGLGAAFISEMSIKKELARGDMAVVRVKGLRISRQFYLISRSKRDLSPSGRAFINFLIGARQS
ncbi:MAG: selenium metabolism-associated LysR family transcriptional regulator [Thermodesulfobacteriota bacterium]